VQGGISGLVSNHLSKAHISNGYVTAPVAVQFGSASDIVLTSGAIKGGTTGIIMETGTVKVEDGIISGDMGIKAPTGTGIEVTMEGGKITGKSHGIYGADDVDLFIHGGLISGEIGVVSNAESGDSKITFTGGKVEGKEFGILVVDSIQANLTGGEINGDTALKFGKNSDILFGGTKVVGTDVGLHGDIVARITGNSGTIKGSRHAVIVGEGSTIPETGLSIEGDIKIEEKKPDPNPGYVTIRRIY
jgi:hypothetical protein